MEILERCYRKDPNIVSRKIADEVILVPIKQKMSDIASIYTLNKAGARIWELIDGKRRVKEIKDVLMEEFEVDPVQAEDDLIEFLQQLNEAEAVKIAG